MIKIDVTVDVRSFAPFFSNLQKQIPYATQLSLNSTAIGVQKDIRSHINEEFIVRRKSFIENSIKITQWAKKDNLTAIVAVSPPGGGTDVLTQHIEGGKKTAVQGTSVAVPSVNIRPDIKRVIPSGKRPRALKKSFVKIEEGRKLLFTKIGRGKAAVVRLAYTLARAVTLRPRFKFYETANKSVSTNWQKNFSIAWDFAMKTKR